MIIEIASNQLDEIGPIIERLREQREDVPENFLDMIRDSVSQENSSLYGNYSEDGSVNGIGLFGKTTSRLSLVFTDGDLELEKQITNTIFEKYSTEYAFIETSGPWISDSLFQHMLELGFSKYDRAYMTLPREDIESLTEPVLPDGMHFDVYTENDRNEISKLVFKCKDGSVDKGVFPHFYETLEYCLNLLESIEANRYGEYMDGLSWILRKGNRKIGACFTTCRNRDTGYIPDIVLDHEFRGQGLGKAMLVHSMKRQLESDSAIVKVDLDVTIGNRARFLYESLGFKDVREHSTYTWMK